MNKLRFITLLVTVATFIAGFLVIPEEKTDERQFLKEITPNFRFTEKSGIPPHYKSENSIVAFNSYDVVPTIRGYAGPIKLLIALNGEGKITGLKVLSHDETINYVHYMVRPEYLSQFLGKSVHEPFEADIDIDAISRATESVTALNDTIRESTRKIAFHVYNLKVKSSERQKHFGTRWVAYFLLFFVAFACYFITRKSKKFLRTRDVSLVSGIIIIGFYLTTPFSILHVLNLILLRLSSSVLWYVILLSTLISIALAGRFYCGWLCPFGALAEFVGRIPTRKWKLFPGTDDRWRIVKYVLLILVVAIALTSRHIEYGNYETYVTLFSFHGNIFTWSLVALMLLINIRVERFWCRFLCPVAALTGLLSRKDNGYVSRKDCPMANKPNPLISECIRCNRCYSAE